MTEKITDLAYNSLIFISIIHFFYLYLGNFLVTLYNLKIVYPFIFIKYTEYLVNTKITKNIEEKVCFTSSIHAFLIIVYSVLYIYNLININIFNTGLYYSALYNTLDIIYMFKYDLKMKKEMTIHHILVITAIMARHLTNVPYNYNYYLAMNFLTEVTTIPLNCSWYLYITNQKNRKEFKIFNILTLILYIPFRVILNTYLFYDELYNLDTNLKYCQLFMVFMNYHWFYKICQMTYKNIIS